MLKSLLTVITLVLLSFSCTTVYVAKPMPHGGTELNKIPLEWSGVFEVKTSDESEHTAFIKNYLRFERLSDSKVLVSTEARLSKQDLPNLDAYIAENKAEGRQIEYQITDRFIFFQKSEPGNELSKKETRVVRVEDAGNWYVLLETARPFMMIDLDKKTALEYGLDNAKNDQDWLFPNADSLVSKDKPLQLRQNGESWNLKKVMC